MGKSILKYTADVSALLSSIAADREKKTKLYLQAQHDLLLFAFHHQNYLYLTIITLNQQTFHRKTLLHIKTLKPMVLGLSQVTKSFPQHKKSQSSEKYREQPMREECSTSFNE